MPFAVRAYVSLIVAAAIVAVVFFARAGQSTTEDQATARAGFAFLGFVFQISTYQLKRGVGGSIGGAISFIPFLTATLIAPVWSTPLVIGCAVGIAEGLRKPGFVKATFNVAQQVLAITLATAIYIRLGGKSLNADETFRLLPYACALSAFFIVNSSLVTGVIAIVNNVSWIGVWRQYRSGTLRYDLLASPLVYIFALVYNRFALAGIIFLALFLVGGRQLYRTNRQLDQTNRDLLEVIVGAIELRDAYTSGHSQRVARHSEMIARAIGLSRREVGRLRAAALLHDVGKIDQRFAVILQKPGRLTAEERSVIEQHPVISAELVARVSGLTDLIPAIRHHHERWDGHGYPDQLRSEAIPLFARIITIADTIDAMTSDRPYRSALDPSEVRTELMRNRGKQFDPDLCDRLLASPLFTPALTKHGAEAPREHSSKDVSVAA